MKVRTALRALLAGWEQDLSMSWRKALSGTQLNWKSRALDCEMSPCENILPGRRRTELPNAPRGAHLFRTFENSHPNQVRAIILGQDPYPNPAWATGRAFEQGNLTKWPEDPQQVADSLRRLVQAIASTRTGNASYVANDRAWRELIRDAQRGVLRLETPRKLFDRLERQGVLFLNTSLTVSVVRAGAPKGCHRHFPLWAPLIDGVLSFIGGRQTGHAVFLLLGRQAADIFDRSSAKTTAERAGTWKTRVDVVRHCHPAAITVDGPAFLRPPNPFCTANELLQRMGTAPLRW